MPSAREIVAWAGGDTAPLLETALPEMRLVAPVVTPTAEVEFEGHLPHRRADHPRLYLIGVDALAGASPGLVALLTGRPSTWPPIVIFALAAETLADVPGAPNSTVVLTAADASEKLVALARYWVDVNTALPDD